jgi:hypothetical protein
MADWQIISYGDTVSVILTLVDIYIFTLTVLTVAGLTPIFINGSYYRAGSSSGAAHLSDGVDWS